MRSLLALLLILGLAACNPPASSPDDGRVVSLEKQDKAFEERVATLERDLVEVRAQLAKETAARAESDARQAAAAAKASAAAAAPPPKAPASSVRSGIGNPGF